MSDFLLSSGAEFRRFWWMPSAHLETVAAAFNKRPLAHYSREIVKTRENDEFALDYMNGCDEQPLVVIFHGLEGCSQSRGVRLMAAGFAAAGWTVAAPNFRTCGGHMNRLPRAYHAADAAEIAWMLNYCRGKFPRAATFAVGVSLGGTALLHHLAKTPDAPLVAAAGLSVPFDLATCVRRLDGGLRRRLYAQHFLKTLRAKVLHKSRHYPSICDIRKLKKATTIGEFDELYTARAHGFASAAAYWHEASVQEDELEKIVTPLLCINALNDPLIPADSLPYSMHTSKNPPSSSAVFCRPKHGGHGGFFGEPENWLYDTVYKFFMKDGDKQ